MATLKPALLAISLLVSAQARADPIERWADAVAEASQRFGIPEEWIRRVMRAESGGRTMIGGRPIVSPAGAQGLMQVMPATWRELRAAHGLGPDPQDPHDNILAGAAYLRAMYDRFGYPGLFAAYNAGPERYAEHLSHGRRLPAETIAYVAAVAGQEPGPSGARDSAAAPPGGEGRAPSLFVIQGEPLAASQAMPSAGPETPPLFFPLRTAAPR